MKYRTHILFVLLLGSLSGVGAGCSLTLATDPPVENRCAIDEDCPSAVCDLTLHMCVSTSTDVLRIGLEVTPVAGAGASSAPTHSLGTFEVDGPDQLELRLPAPINVIGSVRAPGYDEAVSATIRYTRPGAFTGARLVETQTNTVSSPVVAADGMDADYALRVVAEQEYTITVEPSGEWASRLPPRRITKMIPGGGDFYRRDLVYPEAMPVVRGFVIGATEEPVDGVIVRAIDPTSQRVVSSTVTTGSGDFAPGEFSLVLDPEATSYVIRISAGESQPGFPTIFADPAYFFPDADGYVHILVPMLESTCYRGTVELGETTERARGAVITFRTDEVFDETTQLSGTFRTTVTTDENGVFEASLLPASYEVLITPPSDASLERYGVLLETAFRIEPLAGRDCIMGQLFELPVRTRLGGTVRTPDERVMGGASVIATALNTVPDGLAPVGRYNRTSETDTDPTGRFNLPLDVGVYDLTIKPSMDSGFPWIVEPSLTVGTDMETLSDAYELSSPVPIVGTVVDGGDVPAAGAEIRAFGIITDATSGGERAVPIGRATAGDDGTYQLLLPARIGSGR